MTAEFLFDFLAFLKAREKTEGGESLLPLAQSAWAADWDNPEEPKTMPDAVLHTDGELAAPAAHAGAVVAQLPLTPPAGLTM